jgi:hypothetical protein
MLLKRRCCDILPHRHVATSIDGISDAGLPLTYEPVACADGFRDLVPDEPP